ncbi:MAG: LysR family transcriptional regulator, partial [Paracoccaceae bacterium]
MRLEWIEDILSVLDAGSLAGAAERRYLTQSAFTRRVRSIEAAVGVTLFDRSRKPVTLMPGVAAMEPELRRVAADLRRIGQGLRQTAIPAGHVLTITCQHAWATSFAARIVGSLSGLCRVHLRAGNRDDCLMQLVSG